MGSNKGSQENGIVEFILTLIFGERTRESKIRRYDYGAIDVPEEDDVLPYALRRSVLTNTEKKFYNVLKIIVGDKFTILTKVRMEDYVEVVGIKDWKEKQRYRNTIKSRHVDFLLCEPGELKPVLAIELDDSTHNSKKAIIADNKKNSIYEKVGLPILRVKAWGEYSKEKLARSIIKKIRVE